MDENTNNIPSKPVNIQGTAVGLPKYTPVGGSAGSGDRKLTSDEMFAMLQTGGGGAESFTAGELPSGNRYTFAFPGRDTEEMVAQQQSRMDKWGNGIGKFAGTTASTFLQGTVGTVYGIGSMLYNWRGASFYDNSVNRSFSRFNENMEDWMPNYYTQAEKDASWYSGKNIWTANFWSDKVLKNLGFSIGTLAGGFAWGSVLKAIGITSKLASIGKGMETAQAVDDAIINVSKGAKFGEISKTLSSLGTKYIKPATANILSNSDRIFTSVTGTFGEASIEAQQNMNQFREGLIEKYYEEMVNIQRVLT